MTTIMGSTVVRTLFYQNRTTSQHLLRVKLLSSFYGSHPNLKIGFVQNRRSKLLSASIPVMPCSHESTFPAGTRRQLKIGVQGAPVEKGQPKPGVSLGPQACRSSGFIEILRKSVKADIVDYGDIPFPLGTPSNSVDAQPESPASPETTDGFVKAKHAEQIGAANKAISESTARIMRSGRICLTLGGDHSIGIGTIHGASEVHNDIAVLWVDAHADLNTVGSSWSGNIHGMSAGFVIKELEPYMDKLPEFAWLTPRIKAKNIAYIGLRDVDEAERAHLNLLGITAFSMREVDLYGIRKVTQMALESIAPGNKRPLHVTFDIDSLDDKEVRCTGTKVPGGLSLREGIVVLEEVHEAGNLVSMDLVEVNPDLGNDDDRAQTIQAVKHLLINAFGYNRGGLSERSPVPIRK